MGKVKRVLSGQHRAEMAPLEMLVVKKNKRNISFRNERFQRENGTTSSKVHKPIFPKNGQ